MHIIKQTIVTTESQCLKKLLWSHLKVRNICHSTEDLLERLWTTRIEKNMKKKNDPEGDTRIIASDNEMQLGNCGLYDNSSCSLEYDYCSINHTKSKNAGVDKHQ